MVLVLVYLVCLVSRMVYDSNRPGWHLNNSRSSKDEGKGRERSH